MQYVVIFYSGAKPSRYFVKPLKNISDLYIDAVALWSTQKPSHLVLREQHFRFIRFFTSMKLEILEVQLHKLEIAYEGK